MKSKEHLAKLAVDIDEVYSHLQVPSQLTTTLTGWLTKGLAVPTIGQAISLIQQSLEKVRGLAEATHELTEHINGEINTLRQHARDHSEHLSSAHDNLESVIVTGFASTASPSQLAAVKSDLSDGLTSIRNELGDIGARMNKLRADTMHVLAEVPRLTATLQEIADTPPEPDHTMVLARLTSMAETTLEHIRGLQGFGPTAGEHGNMGKAITDVLEELARTSEIASDRLDRLTIVLAQGPTSIYGQLYELLEWAKAHTVNADERTRGLQAQMRELLEWTRAEIALAQHSDSDMVRHLTELARHQRAEAEKATSRHEMVIDHIKAQQGPKVAD